MMGPPIMPGPMPGGIAPCCCINCMKTWGSMPCALHSRIICCIMASGGPPPPPPIGPPPPPIPGGPRIIPPARARTDPWVRHEPNGFVSMQTVCNGEHRKEGQGKEVEDPAERHADGAAGLPRRAHTVTGPRSGARPRVVVLLTCPWP